MAKAKDEKPVRVKFKTCLSGNGFVWNVGDEFDMPADEAGRLAAAGFAELVEGGAAESAAGRTSAGRRGGRPAARPVAPSPEAAGEPPADPPAA